ncbi:MAG: hypothetical protein J7496_08475 [Novosphingobium sp.]|nr:hypothetical protein [Novosphingobium sp.]
MFAFALPALFTAIAFGALGVLIASYARAFAAFGRLRHAAAQCPETVSVTVRIVDPAAPRLRLVSSLSGTDALRPLPQPALRAAA